MARIESLMATEMITARSDETVAEVAVRMQRNQIGAVVIVEDGVLRGLFSERDLLERVVAERRNPEKTRLGDVATREVVTIDVGASVRSVLELFRAKRFRHLPVVRAGKPVGILSTRDFLAYVVEGLERHIERAKYDRELAAGVDPYDHFGGSYGQ